MPLGKLGLLVSPGGKGKTALALHLAGHVAAGVRWCGLEVVSPGAGALVVGEEDRDECHRRIKDAWAQLPEDGRRRAAARTLVLPLAGTGDNRLVTENPLDRNVTESERARELRKYLEAKAPKDGGWKLVVVDPFSRVAGTSAETDNASATRTMEVLELLTKLPGDPTVLVTHHTRKRGKDEGDPVELIRGSSAIKDAARWAAMLDSNGEGRAVLRIVKSNYTSTQYGVELVTHDGIPQSGKVRLVTELDAQRDAERTDSGGSGRAARGSKPNGNRLGPGEV
jgi:RecA-family ATPase